MSDYIEERRSRFKEKLNPNYTPDEYGRREDDRPLCCNDCGHSETGQWRSGDKCPKCKSDRYFPVVHTQSKKKIQRIISGVMLVALIIFCNIVMVSRLKGQETRYHVKLYCSKCDQVFEKEVGISQTFPMKCDLKLHGLMDTAKPAYKCINGHVFGHIQEPIHVEPGKEMDFFRRTSVVCPVCGTDKTSKMNVKIVDKGGAAPVIKYDK